ncbi:hypothetical protein PIB30_076013 [Stylosanthes scabra]|uniref:Uncharacterized protein n=1 Tax=Stylosanthes scabra TaxID=79078 RepID=A0ABU6RQE9_9FABA|nr:hypothetical protein [Stylosanthes scabra]
MDGQNLDACFLFQYIQNQIDDDEGLRMYALAIYGLVLFPRVREQIDGQVIKLFEQTTHGVHPSPAILSETIRVPNTVSKVKEIIFDWKDVRRVKSGVPTWDTTPGYPSWQANRGKGFKAPVITGPEPPMHMFHDPIDYKAEVDSRYEDAFRQLEENEIMLINNYKRSKFDCSSRFDKATNEMAEQKKKTALLEEQLTRMKKKYRLMET